MRAPDLGVTAKLQLMGRSLVLQLHMVLRTMRLHDPNNRALLIASENLKDTINTLWAALDGSVSLQFVEGMVYLNDMRLRLDGAVTEQVRTLQEEFQERGLGGLAFSRPVDGAALKAFLHAFAQPVESEQDLDELRRKLAEFHELALELLEPRHFKDGLDEEQALRVDKRTFALQTYAKTVVAVKEFVRALKMGQDPSTVKLPITRIVQDLVDIATERVNFLLKLAAIKKADDYLYNHAANTCVLSLVMGRALDVDRLSLVDLGTSALFADLGFALIPEEVLENKQELDSHQRHDVNELMIRQIRAIMGKRISDGMLRRAIVAYEHHLPYVDPLTGAPTPTHLFSRIVAVADAFDALTTRRPWREGYTADEALRILLQEAGTKFDPLVVRVLVNLMGIYPLGSVVRLGTGEIGVVYHNSNDPKLFERPWVKIIRDASGEAVRRTLIRNLAEEGEASRIERTVRPRELGPDFDPGMAIIV
jgi:HD-GYP domain-containing protein (c-di-GMP phosphodiesterase class II)